jgi:CDP-diacylglycerol--glycerol-3-phosphate 3-phosphatidyltransferase
MDSGSKLRFVTCLTFVRFPLVLLFFAGALVYANGGVADWLFVASFAALVASAVTDLLDGHFARRFNVVTELGAHADPLMDKFFYLATMPLLVFVAATDGHGRHASFLLVLSLLFLVRDQWVTFLRAIGSMYRASGAAHWAGKLRTAVNFPAICGIYFFEEAPERWQFLNPRLIYLVEILALVINVISMVTYTRAYWPYLRRSARVPPAGTSDS